MAPRITKKDIVLLTPSRAGKARIEAEFRAAESKEEEGKLSSLKGHPKINPQQDFSKPAPSRDKSNSKTSKSKKLKKDLEDYRTGGQFEVDEVIDVIQEDRIAGFSSPYGVFYPEINHLIRSSLQKDSLSYDGGKEKFLDCFQRIFGDFAQKNTIPKNILLKINHNFTQICGLHDKLSIKKIDSYGRIDAYGQFEESMNAFFEKKKKNEEKISPDSKAKDPKFVEMQQASEKDEGKSFLG